MHGAACDGAAPYRGDGPHPFSGPVPAGSAPAIGEPPQWDPAYQPVGEVMVRDLARYAAVAESGGGA